MAKCEICGKEKVFFKQVSHSNRKSTKTWSPNLRTVRADINGESKKIKVCAKCLRTANKDANK